MSFALEQAGVHPLLARLLAARGVRRADELDDGLARLLPPADAEGQRRGRPPARRRHRSGASASASSPTTTATAPPPAPWRCAAWRCWAPTRDTLGYVVPDRAVHGYGLTPAIVDLAQAPRARPDVLVTVDNGIASLAGVAHARALGLRVLVTDHHLPALSEGAVVLPDANVIVNPNQPGCALREQVHRRRRRHVLRAAGDARRAARTRPLRRGAASRGSTRCSTSSRWARWPTSSSSTPTTAASSPRASSACAAAACSRGWRRCSHAAGRDAARAAGFDFGFALGPRINAAGRLSDMTLGIECLLTDDATRAAELAAQLDAINRERREVEAGMRELAEATVERLHLVDARRRR